MRGGKRNSMTFLLFERENAISMLRILVCLFFALPAFAGETKQFVDDPAAMSALEKSGAAFSLLAFGTEAASNAKLFEKSEGYRVLVSELRGDLAAAKMIDPTLTVTMKSVHRMFNAEWLKSPEASFELTGVVHRADRAPFKSASCGEVRFLYRLAYLKTAPSRIYSRLPMTANLVFWPAAGDCAASAARWKKFLSSPEKFRELLGPMKSVEVNLQSVRWPSTIRADMGGYAEYVLRVFHPRAGGGLVPGLLENTPDLGKLGRTPALKKKLLEWLKNPQNLRAVDQGIAVLPDEFLATSAQSVALHGVHRLANAPFTRLFGENELSDVKYAEYATFKSAYGLLRRLNDLSCMGCHQGRTVAGFHFLGRDRADTDAVNAIFVSSSAHFITDQKRRQDFYEAVLAKKKPSFARPLSVRAEEERGFFGAHCGLGDPSFSAWTCASGFECKPVIADDRVSRTGVCVPMALTAGTPCQPARMKHDTNPHRDRAVLGGDTACASGDFCEDTSVGFPGGMCSGGCEGLREGETCGSIAELAGFNGCLSRGKDPFAKCLRENVRPGALKSCSETEACRDDYICARTAAGAGACIPPYFLFQLRVDGHPKPG
jgi:hypothetical protein